MTNLLTIKKKIDYTFKINEWGLDPQMEVFLPRAYSLINFDWKPFFERDFINNLNGLMIKGSDEVKTVFLASFPHPEVLKRFIDQSEEGDLFFTHHPVYMLCGDPRGEFGAGWQPIPVDLLEAIKAKRLSFYSCHGPMDYDRILGPRAAMIQTIDAHFEEDFFFDGKGSHGAICSIDPINVDELAERLRKTYDLPYVDLAGKKKRKITKIAIIAGGADNLDYMKQAEKKGVDAYIAGEIFTRLNTEWGKENNPRMISFSDSTNMTMIGLSHSGSEYLTMKVQMADWFKSHFDVKTFLLPQDNWWI